MWILVVLGVFLVARPAVTIWPQTIAPVISNQFERVEGYGLSVRSGDVSLSYNKASYRSHESSGLLDLGGNWVYSREVGLWELNYSFYRKRSFGVGAGLNKTDSERLGWQIYAENNFGGFVFARLGFRRVWVGKAVDGVVAGFGFDVVKCAKAFWAQEIRGRRCPS